jgi:oligo-alginate lyase
MLFADPAAFRRDVAAVIAREGTDPVLRSVNKQEWHIAILRSGKGDNARALWLDYDTGGNHCHLDGMNIGLFAKGLDLLPEMGYPPVQYGGWESPRARWYTMSAAHNTVVVDGKSSVTAAGKTTLWADGDAFRAIRADGPELIGGKQFERTLAMVDISDRDFYALDVFRVTGGSDHARFMHSHFGEATATGLNLHPAPDYGHDTQMRSFRIDPAAQPGWSVDWKVEDHYRLLKSPRDIHMRMTDLTTGADAGIAEGWISVGGYNATEEVWIPRVMVRCTGSAPLTSAFVGVLQPYEGQPAITSIRRLPLKSDADVAVEITLADGRRDLLIAQQATGNEVTVGDIRTDAELLLVRRDASGAVQRIAICHGRAVTLGGFTLRLKRAVDFLEVLIEGGVAKVAAGSKDDVESLTVR